MLSVISKSTGRAVYILFKCNVNIKTICKCNQKQALFYSNYSASKTFGVKEFDENITEKLSYVEADDFEIVREDNFSHAEPDKINSENQLKIPTNNEASVIAENSEFKELDINDDNQFFNENYSGKNVLTPGLEDVSHIAPIVRPSFNFAAYADKSEVLQKLLALGVDFYKLEHLKSIPSYLVLLNYKNDIEPYIRFLLKVGVESDKLGRFITLNPNLFKEHLDDLQVRINYLESKNFKPEVIARIVSVNPRWLSYKVADIDSALGYFQNEFRLSGEEVRLVAAKNPKLITRNRNHLIRATFTIREEMGFSYNEVKQLMLTVPKIWHIRNYRLFGTFDVLHNEMGVPHAQIVEDPKALLMRTFKIKERHEFLKSLNKAQYNPEKQMYISLTKLVTGSDVDFCSNVAKVPIDLYNDFLKTL